MIGHLIDCDGPAFGDRIAVILDGVDEIPPHDIHVAIATQSFADQPAVDLIGELRASRRRAGDYLRTLDPIALGATSSFPDGRLFSACDFVHEWPFHDQDHLQQILDATKRAYLVGMGPAMRDGLLD